jgi:hypothetical protein
MNVEDFVRRGQAAQAAVDQHAPPAWNRDVPDAIRKFANALIDAGWPQGGYRKIVMAQGVPSIAHTAGVGTTSE